MTGAYVGEVGARLLHLGTTAVRMDGEGGDAPGSRFPQRGEWQRRCTRWWAQTASPHLWDSHAMWRYLWPATYRMRDLPR